MAYSLVISERASHQIDEIIGYVALELGNPSAARSILNDIEKAYGRLSFMAESTPLCRDIHLARRGYRKCILDHHDYVILYLVKGEEVRISGVFHMREAYSKKL